MALSTMTAYTPITANSLATVGLWDRRFEALQANVDQINNLASGGTAVTATGFSTNTLRAESGNTITLLAPSTALVAKSVDSGGAIFNITAFGAIADNATNAADSIHSAWQAAKSAGSGVVYVPHGIFRVGSSLTLDGTGVSLRGPGTLRALSLPAGGSMLSISGTNITVEDVTLDQNNTTTGRTIRLNGAVNTVIKNVHSVNVQQAFVYIIGATVDTYVLNCNHDIGGYGIFVSDPTASRGLYVIGNRFRYNKLTGTGDGIEINAPTSGFSQFIIANNFISGFTGEASSAGIGIGLSSASQGVIADNYILDVASDGIHIERGSNNVAITGNIIKGTGKPNPAGGNGNGIAVYRSSNVVVKGNIVHSVISAYGILVQSTQTTNPLQAFGNIVEGNSVDSVDRSGIRLAGQVGFLCNGNFVKNASRESSNGFFGIELARVSGVTVQNSDGIITQNVIHETSTVTLAAGISTTSNEPRVQIYGNELATLVSKTSYSGNTTGSLDLAQIHLVSIRTLDSSAITASAANTNVVAGELVFTVGASGASLAIYSGNTVHIFNSSTVSAKVT
jgi:parallel beta helix pectate lyase-like protein